MVEEVNPRASHALQQIADKIAAARKILIVTGAGISTNCGIPDFRSTAGLYSLIENDYATRSARTDTPKRIKGRDLFDISVWNTRDTAAVFLRFIANLRRKIVVDVKEPSTTHRFIKLLRDQRRLVRSYTQNIDGLEQRVGLRTDLTEGRGSRSRFTKKTLALPPSPSNRLPGGALHGGCEAVQLHGDLELLRCSVCQKLVSWDEEGQSDALLDGTAPECPSCLDQDELRRLAGRRRIRVGVLRPNVVLYGEEHPSADAIGRLVTADIASRPDLLLIFGTSLKVHGLQNIVKEFANAVHGRKDGAGKVIFINNTPPTNSMWQGIIDTWVNMDCDAFVSQIRAARPDIWTRQLPLPFPVGKIEKETTKERPVDLLQEKENFLAVGATTGRSTSSAKDVAKDGIRKKLSPSIPLRERCALGDIAVKRPEPSNSVFSPVGKKRKSSNDFEIYEDEPIVVVPTQPWALKGVLVPSPDGTNTSSPPRKRQKIM